MRPDPSLTAMASRASGRSAPSRSSGHTWLHYERASRCTVRLLEPSRTLTAGEYARLSFCFSPGELRHHAALRVALRGPPPPTRFRIELRGAPEARPGRMPAHASAHVAWSDIRAVDAARWDVSGGRVEVCAGPVPVVGKYTVRVIMVGGGGGPAPMSKLTPIDVSSEGTMLLNVTAGVAAAAQCALRPRRPARVKTNPAARDGQSCAHGRAGEPIEVVLVARDAFGNRRNMGGEAPYVVVRRGSVGAATSELTARSGREALTEPSVSTLSSLTAVAGSEDGCVVEDIGDGSYNARFSRHVAGPYIIRAWVHGQEIAKPLMCHISPASVDPTTSIVRLRRLEEELTMVPACDCTEPSELFVAGQRSQFWIVPRDRFGNRCPAGLGASAWYVTVSASEQGMSAHAAEQSVRIEAGQVEHGGNPEERGHGAVATELHTDSVRVSLVFPREGTYRLAVFGIGSDGERGELVGSPFDLGVRAADLDAEQTIMLPQAAVSQTHEQCAPSWRRELCAERARVVVGAGQRVRLLLGAAASAAASAELPQVELEMQVAPSDFSLSDTKTYADCPCEDGDTTASDAGLETGNHASIISASLDTSPPTCVQLPVERAPDGELSTVVQVQRAGKHVLHVRLSDGEPMDGSPFTLHVTAGPIHSPSCMFLPFEASSEHEPSRWSVSESHHSATASPVECSAALLSSHTSTARGNRPVAQSATAAESPAGTNTGAYMVAGEAAFLTFIAKDRFGNACALGPASFFVYFERLMPHLQYMWSPHVAHATVKELSALLTARVCSDSVENVAGKDSARLNGKIIKVKCSLQETSIPGVFQVILRAPRAAGRYAARAVLLDEALEIPLDCYVRPGVLSIAHSSADGPGVSALPATAEARFQITPLDRYGNQCGVPSANAPDAAVRISWHVSIQARAAAHAEAAAAAQDSLCIEENSDGSYLVRTRYSRSGVYVVHVSGVAQSSLSARNGGNEAAKMVSVAGSPFELLVTPSPEDAAALRLADEWDGECVAGESVDLPFIPAQLDDPYRKHGNINLTGSGSRAEREAEALMHAYVQTIEAAIEREGFEGTDAAVAGSDADTYDGCGLGIVTNPSMRDRGAIPSSSGCGFLSSRPHVVLPVRLCPDGRVRMRFIPRLASDAYYLHVRATGRPIAGSPFKFRVSPGPPHGPMCRFAVVSTSFVPSNIKSTRPADHAVPRVSSLTPTMLLHRDLQRTPPAALVVGETHTIRLYTFDACGNSTCCVGVRSAIRASMTFDENEAVGEGQDIDLLQTGTTNELVTEGARAISVAHLSDGCFELRLSRERAGMYVLNVFFGGVSEPSSPATMHVQMTPAMLSIGHSTLRLPHRAVATEDTVFWIQPRDRFGNKMLEHPKNATTGVGGSCGGRLLNNVVRSIESTMLRQTSEPRQGDGSFMGASWRVLIRSISQEQKSAAILAEQAVRMRIKSVGGLVLIACTTTFTRPGLYSVGILAKEKSSPSEETGIEEEVLDSPFVLRVDGGVADPTQSAIIPTTFTPTQAGEPFTFFILARDACGNPLTAASVLEAVSARLVFLGERKVLMSPGANHPPEPRSQSAGTSCASVQCHVRSNDRLDAHDEADCGRLCAWATAFGSTSGEEQIDINLSPTDSVVANAVARAHDFAAPLVQVIVTIRKAGCYQLCVRVHEEEVRGSPVSTEVEAASAVPSACAIVGWPAGTRWVKAADRLACSAPEIGVTEWWTLSSRRAEVTPMVAGEVRTLRLLAYDAYGNRRSRGGDLVRMLLRGASRSTSAPVRWDQAGRCYEMELSTTVSGPLEVFIGINGGDVFGGPHFPPPPTIYVLPGAPARAHVISGALERAVAGGAAPLLLIGQPVHFEVEIEDQFGNRVQSASQRLRAHVHLLQGDAVTRSANTALLAAFDSPTIKALTDGTFAIAHTPSAEGKYRLDLVLSSESESMGDISLGFCQFVVMARPTLPTRANAGLGAFTHSTAATTSG